MNMSDELSGAVVGISSQVAQKGVETAQHVVDKTIDNIAKLMQAIFSKKGEKQGKDVKSSDMTDIKSGEVCVKELVANSKKNGDTVVCTDGYSKADKKFISKKAKEYGIPVAFTGKENADNICGHVRGSDKAIFERICTEMMNDKIKIRPQELENFKAERWEIDGIHRELSKHDLNANWGKTQDGEYFCLFEKADKKAVLMARDQFVQKCKEVESDLTITKDDDGFYTLKDEKCGSVLTFDEIPSKSELSAMFQEKFSYDENKAEIACGKFGESQLDGDLKRDYFSNNPQNEFSKIENHVELKNESILVKDFDCLRVTPKTNGVPCLVYRDEKNNFAVLNPDKMTRKQMSAVIRESLNIEDEKTVKALVEKAEKVNDYYSKQNNENYSITRSEIIGEVADDKSIEFQSDIERLDKDKFKVDTKVYSREFTGLNVGDASRSDENVRTAVLVLSFSDKRNALSELQAMYKAQGLSDEMAKQSAKDVFTKAQAQSAEKVLHIEKIKVDKQSAEAHGATPNEATESVMTVKYGGQSEEIAIGDREATLAEVGDKFGVSEDEAEVLINRAEEIIDDSKGESVEQENVITNDKTDAPLNGHEMKPTEAVELEVKTDKPAVDTGKVELPAVPSAPKRK